MVGIDLRLTVEEAEALQWALRRFHSLTLTVVTVPPAHLASFDVALTKAIGAIQAGVEWTEVRS